MKTSTEVVTEIRTCVGIIRIWQISDTQFGWATPQGNEGRCLTFDNAVKDAFEAEELKPADYGY